MSHTTIKIIQRERLDRARHERLAQDALRARRQRERSRPRFGSFLNQLGTAPVRMLRARFPAANA